MYVSISVQVNNHRNLLITMNLLFQEEEYDEEEEDASAEEEEERDEASIHVEGRETEEVGFDGSITSKVTVYRHHDEEQQHSGTENVPSLNMPYNSCSVLIEDTKFFSSKRFYAA